MGTVNKSRVKGATALRRKLRRMPEEFNQELRQAIAEGAEQLRSEMASRVPVSPWWRTRETGHLRDAIETSITLKGRRARVGIVQTRTRNIFYYARFLEFGTRAMQKRPFAFPAWLAVGPAVRQRLKHAAQVAFRRAANMRFSDG